MMKRKNFLTKSLALLCSMIMALTLVATGAEALIAKAAVVMPKYSGGTGTQEDPYLISTADDLVAMSEFLNTVEEPIDAKDNCGLGGYHGYYFKQTADIDMSSVNWTPFDFCGVYDGCGYEIKNLKVSEKRFNSTESETGNVQSNEYEAAFFGQLVHAEIMNMTFSDCTSTIAETLTPDADRDIYVAIVAATAIAARFENVKTVNCTVEQNAKEGNLSYAAPIVAYADICNLTNCSAEGGSVTAAKNADYAHVGGLVGGVGDVYYRYMKDYSMVLGAGQPFGIYNGFTSATLSNEKGWAGGIVGTTQVSYISHTIETCYVSSNITANVAAGIIGYGSEKDIVNKCVVNSNSFEGTARAYTIIFGADKASVTNSVFATASDTNNIEGTAQATQLTPKQVADGDACKISGHMGGTATCTKQAICRICSQPYGECSPHVAGTEYYYDLTQHWKKCTICEQAVESTKEAHASTVECATCGYKMVAYADLETAVKELDKAIKDGDKELNDKITALNEALEAAKAALEATDAANKADLEGKITTAQEALVAAIDALSRELDATNEEVEQLKTFIIIVCVISGVAFCGCGTLTVFYILDKKKKVNK